MSNNREGQGDAYTANNEVAFLVEEVSYVGFVHNYKLKVKLIIPSLIPLMKSSTVVKQTDATKITSKSTGKSHSAKLTKINYITASLPINLAWKFVNRSYVRRFGFGSNDVNLFIHLYIPKNTEFVISFVGDDINKIRIVALNERGKDTNHGISPV